MVYKLYYLLSQVSFPLIRLWVWLRKLIGKECPKRYNERFGKTNLSFPINAQERVWIHAASIGETLSAIPLIKSLKRRGVSVVLTTITRTSADIAVQRLPDIIHQYAPYDHPYWLKRFLNHWKPNALVLIESEFWPNMLMQTNAMGIPIHLVNARFSPKSFKRWRKYGVYFKSVFEKISFATTPHKRNVQLLSELGVKFCRYMPNLKFMADPLPFDKTERDTLKKKLSTRSLWVGASIREGEENIFAGFAQQLALQTDPAQLAILIPRHPHVVEKLKAICSEKKLRFCLRSDGDTPKSYHDVWIIDTFGELGLFYALAPLTIMGGTFANCGAHNPIEAILHGSGVIMGPSRHNFNDIIDLLSPAALLAA